jgi:hypothetical protein
MSFHPVDQIVRRVYFLEGKMCDCRKKVEINLLDRYKEQHPEANKHQARLKGYTLILGKQVEEKGCMPIEFTAVYPLKKGGEKEKTVKQSMVFTYCPFCGEKYA